MPSSDTYMELSDPAVWGETYDSQFGMDGRALGAFEVATFKIGVSAAADEDEDDGHKKKAAHKPHHGSKSGASIKEPTLQNITISKFIDKASPDLFLACCKKNKIHWAIVSVRETGEENRNPYLVIEFRNLHVTSFSWDVNPGDPEAAATMETVEFDYETVLLKYSRQDLTGEHPVVKMKGWNRPLHNDDVQELDARLGAGDIEDGGTYTNT
jgi:type VI secretion system secreted protein Hcp